MVQLSESITVSLVSSIVGGLLVAVVNYFSQRRKVIAEARKIEAEAEKTKAETTKIIIEMDLVEDNALNARRLRKGWFASGDTPFCYDIGVDRTVFYSGKASGYIRSRPNPRGFATLMQQFAASDYEGKRVRMSGYVATEDIKDYAGLWMRVDGIEKKSISFDNMSDRPITGTTDWQRYDVVLDVPENATKIAFGILLRGKGKVWVDDLEFEVVSKNVPTTASTKRENLPQNPQNLDFED